MRREVLLGDRSSGVEMNTLESAQSDYRLDNAAHRVMHLHLNHLITGPATCVRHCDGGFSSLGRRDADCDARSMLIDPFTRLRLQFFLPDRFRFRKCCCGWTIVLWRWSLLQQKQGRRT